MDKAMRAAAPQKTWAVKIYDVPFKCPNEQNSPCLSLSLSNVVPDVFGVSPIAGNIHCISKRPPVRSRRTQRKQRPIPGKVRIVSINVGGGGESFQVNQLFSLQSHFN